MANNKDNQNKKRYGVYLDEDIYVKLRELSHDKRLSISGVITQYILSDTSLSARGKAVLKELGYDPDL